MFPRILAEFVGTLCLVVIGCGAMVIDVLDGGVVGHLGVSLAFGLAIFTMTAATGHISGAHFNPVVTVAFASIGRFRWAEVPVYVISQCTGAVLGALVLRAWFGNVAHLGATLSSGSVMQTLSLEIWLTFILMFVIASVARGLRAEKSQAALAIGATVAMCVLFGGPISGASMNPARSLGPALVAGAWRGWWIYWVGPLIGAVIGGVVYRFTASATSMPRSS